MAVAARWSLRVRPLSNTSGHSSTSATGMYMLSAYVAFGMPQKHGRLGALHLGWRVRIEGEG